MEELKTAIKRFQRNKNAYESALFGELLHNAPDSVVSQAISMTSCTKAILHVLGEIFAALCSQIQGKAVVTTDFRPIVGRRLFYKYFPCLILARVESQSALEPHQPKEPHTFRMVRIVSAPGGRHVFHKHTHFDYQPGFVASIGARGLHCFQNVQMGSPNGWCGFCLLYLRNNYLVRVQQRLCNCFGFIGGSLGRRFD
jgi:hypothetical protein